MTEGYSSEGAECEGGILATAELHQASGHPRVQTGKSNLEESIGRNVLQYRPVLLVQIELCPLRDVYYTSRRRLLLRGFQHDDRVDGVRRLGGQGHADFAAGLLHF